MRGISEKFAANPLLARVAPFLVYAFLTTFQGKLGPDSKYWIYALKTFLGAWVLFLALPYVAEVKWKFTWEAVLVGVAVCVMWIGLDPYYPRLDELFHTIGQKLGFNSAAPKADRLADLWNPFVQYGTSVNLARFFVVVRIVGSSLIVPPCEELFYRSFLYRYIVKADFNCVSLGSFNLRAFLLTSIVFGLSHGEWLAGVLCGFAYQGLVCWKGRLGDAITAHSITNFLLGIWIIWKGAWQFW
ncbi:MAG: amino terminal protease family protein [Verrucomicrobiales bacterium]|nr:amino terminal protease family protein [Verrucomicrobiales bacterium]